MRMRVSSAHARTWPERSGSAADSSARTTVVPMASTGAFRSREDGLITLQVLGAYVALDVRRQRHLPRERPCLVDRGAVTRREEHLEEAVLRLALELDDE